MNSTSAPGSEVVRDQWVHFENLGFTRALRDISKLFVSSKLAGFRLRLSTAATVEFVFTSLHLLLLLHPAVNSIKRGSHLIYVANFAT
ncbi:hypothetical protein F2P81_014565 [Scophthalmus maximus]|uniref:Uncharacterized protein n=1 Tax=Scophthalmus maximus TaxID=52904 RepID=A0A6A4SI50_SCOMX|nr:hypothetical protein F2P81_014565 [Scophthalmus maximus]